MTQIKIEPKLTTRQKLQTRELIAVTTNATMRSVYRTLVQRFFWGVFGCGVLVGSGVTVIALLKWI